MRYAAFFATLLAAAAAWGRAADGTLDIIRTPNGGVPALVVPGEAFEAILTAQAPLQLVAPDGEPLIMGVEWSEQPGGLFRAACTVPPGTPPGAYALAAAGDRTDTNTRAVFVFESFPDTYSVAHVTDTHVGREGADETFRRMVARLNETRPAFALVTGDLTDQGTPEQFRLFLEILEGCAVPTFVCAGNHDRKGLNYKSMFGPDAYMFRFGPDGYIVFDTKDAVIAPEWGRQDADLQRFRRAIKPCRWAIGATHRYDPGMGMRAQLVLFADDPLNLLLVGHEHRARTTMVPWGRTRLVLTSAALRDAMRVLLVSPRGIAANAGGLAEEIPAEPARGE